MTEENEDFAPSCPTAEDLPRRNHEQGKTLWQRYGRKGLTMALVPLPSDRAELNVYPLAMLRERAAEIDHCADEVLSLLSVRCVVAAQLPAMNHPAGSSADGGKPQTQIVEHLLQLAAVDGVR